MKSLSLNWRIEMKNARDKMIRTVDVVPFMPVPDADDPEKCFVGRGLVLRDSDRTHIFALTDKAFTELHELINKTAKAIEQGAVY
jgi:hypothetical protein